MPTPRLPEVEARRRFQLIEEALALGHPPPGTSSGTKTALTIAAERAGIPRGSALGWLLAAERVLGPFPWPQHVAKTQTSSSAIDYEMERLRKELLRKEEIIKQLRNETKILQREQVTAEEVRDTILRVCTADMSPPKWAEVPCVSAKAPGIPVLFLSDFHWGETVDPVTIGNVNKYDLATARSRLKRVTERTIRLLRDYQANPVYPGLVLLLGGDLVSGEIHPELAATNQADPYPVLLDLVENLSASVTLFLSAFERIWIVSTFGNHGRNDPKPRFKRRAERNLDWLAGQLLAKQFANEKRVAVSAPISPDSDFSIYGLRYRLTHGDLLGVKGGDGIIGALGPIARGTKKTSDVAMVTGSPFDVLVMGHWHQTVRLDRVIVNGSLIGWNEYAAFGLRAVPEPPKQSLWFCHPDHGITQTWDVFADPKTMRRPFRMTKAVVL